PHRRGGLRRRSASRAPRGALGGLPRAPPLLARRRRPAHRLAALRAHRPLPRQAVRGRLERELPGAARSLALDAVLVPRRLEARLRTLPGGVPDASRPQAARPRGPRDLRRGRRRLRAAFGQAPRGRASRPGPPGGGGAGRARTAALEGGRGEPAAWDLRADLRPLRGP